MRSLFHSAILSVAIASSPSVFSASLFLELPMLQYVNQTSKQGIKGAGNDISTKTTEMSSNMLNDLNVQMLTDDFKYLGIYYPHSHTTILTYGVIPGLFVGPMFNFGTKKSTVTVGGADSKGEQSTNIFGLFGVYGMNFSEAQSMDAVLAVASVNAKTKGELPAFDTDPADDVIPTGSLNGQGTAMTFRLMYKHAISENVRYFGGIYYEHMNLESKVKIDGAAEDIKPEMKDSKIRLQLAGLILSI